MVGIKISYSGLAALGITTLIGCGPTSASKIDSVRQESSLRSDVARSSFPADTELYLNPIYGIEDVIRQYEGRNPEAASLLRDIASQPSAIWLGEWSGDVEQTTREIMRQAGNKLVTFAFYRVPDRDCGQHSAGGASDLAEYKAWIDAAVRGIGNGQALVVLEPDALTLQDCLSGDRLQARFEALTYAVQSLKTNPKTRVYIDAGHSSWLSAEETARRLKQVGIEYADGFALNTSNYRTTASNVEFGRRVASLLDVQKSFIIDTSRNGNGPLGTEWCNPAGRALGEKPNLNPNIAGLDALLWVKRPGESDGYCNGGPAAGQFWPDYAIELAKNARN